MLLINIIRTVVWIKATILNYNIILRCSGRPLNATQGGKQMSKVVLMDFYAEWCGPCKMQDPINEEIKKKFGDKIEFKKVDVDTNYELAAKYTVHAVPTLILEKDGTLFKRYVGVTHASVLETDINAALK
jgi:thioredoxin 1